MEVLERNSDEVLIAESAVIRRAEKNVAVLQDELAEKNWLEIWHVLCKSELCALPVIRKMSSNVQSSLKSIILETKRIFVLEKEHLNPSLASSIQNALTDITKIL
ncbi:MAG: hypothetical protein PWQ35_250 [Patescibacteria group bacterium]|nr:hypothetical protein [Patescibacteria group bacterium]